MSSVMVNVAASRITRDGALMLDPWNVVLLEDWQVNFCGDTAGLFLVEETWIAVGRDCKEWRKFSPCFEVNAKAHEWRYWVDLARKQQAIGNKPKWDRRH